MSLPVIDPDAPAFTRCHVNLADARLGAEALAASDDFFADKARMLERAPAVFIPGKYDTNGKWMDGWESRRKRTTGHDWCVVKLAYPGVIHGLDIDTSHFTGNFPPAASLEGCHLPDGIPDGTTEWQPVLTATALKGNSHHYFPIENPAVFTHLRLNIFPDGGIARLRVYGTPFVEWEKKDSLIDLAAIENGSRIVGANNQHFGMAMNLLMPGRGENMGDGWETRRRREPGNDWCIIALAHPGVIRKITVDTAFFKGNYPDRCSIQAAQVSGGTDESIITQSMFWPTLLPEQKLEMDREHCFEAEPIGSITHVKLNIFPRWRRFTTAAVGCPIMKILPIEPLTKEAFAPYGDVIELEGAIHYPINLGTSERYHDLAKIDTCEEDGRTLVNLFQGQPREMPFEIRMMERHPMGSQAFIPLTEKPYLVVVGGAGELCGENLRAFITKGWQGVNYARDVWHHPLLVLDEPRDFIVIDRGGEGLNLVERNLLETYWLAL